MTRTVVDYRSFIKVDEVDGRSPVERAAATFVPDPRRHCVRRITKCAVQLFAAVESFKIMPPDGNSHVVKSRLKIISLHVCNLRIEGRYERAFSCDLFYGRAKSAAKSRSSAKNRAIVADRCVGIRKVCTLRKSMQFARLDLKSIALLNRGAGADIACASRGSLRRGKRITTFKEQVVHSRPELQRQIVPRTILGDSRCVSVR